MNKLKLQINNLEINTMASGNLSLKLTEDITFEDFTEFAEEFVKFLGGKIISISDAIDTIIWEIEIDNSLYWLVYEDFPLSVSLDSKDRNGSEKIPKIREYILNLT